MRSLLLLGTFLTHNATATPIKLFQHMDENLLGGVEQWHQRNEQELIPNPQLTRQEQISPIPSNDSSRDLPHALDPRV